MEKYVSDIEDLDGQIIDIFDELNIVEDDANRVAEITKQVDFQSDVCMKLSSLATCFPNKEDDNTHADNKSDLLGDVKVKLSPLKCVSFSGKTVDKLEFKNFLLQLHNCIDAAGKLSKSAKLTYLRSYLTDYAFKVVSHLSITDSNYEVALQLLKDEFLDVEYIIDETFKQLLSSSPKYDPSFSEVRIYINECRALLHELTLPCRY